MSQVLIVEDEMNTAKPVKEALALEGISADIAADGIAGVRMFEEGNYDLVLLDLKMPGKSGEDVAREIRKSDPFVDIIVYTNYSDFTDIKRLTNIGIDGYINKGADADLPELIEAIRSKLSPLDDTFVIDLLRSLPEE